MVLANQLKLNRALQTAARDAINRRQDKRLIIVETAIHRVFVMILPPSQLNLSLDRICSGKKSASGC
jgi:hypothetical protein